VKRSPVLLTGALIVLVHVVVLALAILAIAFHSGAESAAPVSSSRGVVVDHSQTPRASLVPARGVQSFRSVPSVGRAPARLCVPLCPLRSGLRAFASLRLPLQAAPDAS
jgi:hypothetical protein